MRGAITAVLGAAMLLTLASPTLAQTEKPTLSSASLQGLQPRSINAGSTQLRSMAIESQPTNPDGTNARLNPYNEGTPSGPSRFSVTDRIQVGAESERGVNQLGVYPVQDTSTGNKVQVLFELNPK